LGGKQPLPLAFTSMGIILYAMISLSHPVCVPQAWHTTILSYANTIVTLLINVMGDKSLPRFEGTILTLHILGFFAILIPSTYMADHKPTTEALTHL
jgi:hypothetical protein